MNARLNQKYLTLSYFWPDFLTFQLFWRSIPVFSPGMRRNLRGFGGEFSGYFCIPGRSSRGGIESSGSCISRFRQHALSLSRPGFFRVFCKHCDEGGVGIDLFCGWNSRKLWEADFSSSVRISVESVLLPGTTG